VAVAVAVAAETVSLCLSIQEDVDAADHRFRAHLQAPREGRAVRVVEAEVVVARLAEAVVAQVTYKSSSEMLHRAF
jgi:hypothetical protein